MLVCFVTTLKWNIFIEQSYIKRIESTALRRERLRARAHTHTQVMPGNTSTRFFLLRYLVFIIIIVTFVVVINKKLLNLCSLLTQVLIVNEFRNTEIAK